jgi:hypothetical protein
VRKWANRTPLSKSQSNYIFNRFMGEKLILFDWLGSSTIRSVGSWWKHPLAEPPDSGIAAYAVSVYDLSTTLILSQSPILRTLLISQTNNEY